MLGAVRQCCCIQKQTSDSEDDSDGDAGGFEGQTQGQNRTRTKVKVTGDDGPKVATGQKSQKKGSNDSGFKKVSETYSGENLTQTTIDSAEADSGIGHLVEPAGQQFE